MNINEIQIKLNKKFPNFSNGIHLSKEEINNNYRELGKRAEDKINKKTLIYLDFNEKTSISFDDIGIIANESYSYEDFDKITQYIKENYLD